MTQPVAFVSDVHLRHGDEPYQAAFLRFLREVGPDVSRLYIHGDLFDFYVGPRQGRLPFYRPLFDTLRSLVEDGTPVGLLHGNRDFLMGQRFVESGVEVLPTEVDLVLGGQRVHLSHGDEFCIHDRSYQFWARGVLRAAPVRLMVRSLPSWVALWLARRYRSVSRRKARRLDTAPRGRLPTILDGVRLRLEAAADDVIICGHIHHLAETGLQAAERRVRLFTTGAWEQGPNAILFDGKDFRIIEPGEDGSWVASLGDLAGRGREPARKT